MAAVATRGGAPMGGLGDIGYLKGADALTSHLLSVIVGARNMKAGR